MERSGDQLLAGARLALNPPSKHIGPAAKHSWEDRSSGAPELKPDRYVAYEGASTSAREARSAHARDAAEAAEARSRVETLDAEIAALEAEQRRADAAARRRKEAAARREAERRRAEAKRDEERKACRTALGRLPGGVELLLANLADIDPEWNVDGNDATTGGNINAALDAAVATAKALRKRVSRVRELFATPGGDAALVAALEDRSPSWSHTGTPTDIERALDVAERRLDRQAAQLGAPGGPRGGTGVPGCAEHGVAANERGVQRVHRYRPAGPASHADAVGARPRGCHHRRAARAAGSARPGEAALRVGAGASRKTAGQAAPVEGGAP